MKEKNRRAALEMLELGADLRWTPMAGFPGLEAVTLGDDLNEQEGRGARTRLVRFSPGAMTGDRLIHSYWEEVLVLSGRLATRDTDAADKHARDRTRNSEASNDPAMRYSLRPPGTAHGPFISLEGCVLFEVQYFLAD
jgi:hypothetical protein